MSYFETTFSSSSFTSFFCPKTKLGQQASRKKRLKKSKMGFFTAVDNWAKNAFFKFEVYAF
ncbi:MAG: hypothetical protein COW03_16310 [Cytophagales bacterium CG12_big_fil_rev_8_21_14_0_65_40_12]|nr:MAG: hypothetical protein COW03_16310 [Cytophagales bacterium CG12_big_fil_rev_8_21_14_0_65_40_12]PIW05288.1 MAG: hypothetical protein COW40_05105 [Cytophagales bacterium CG17_big_fil_post_rev_8_21_14_2_50_40_13]